MGSSCADDDPDAEPGDGTAEPEGMTGSAGAEPVSDVSAEPAGVAGLRPHGSGDPGGLPHQSRIGPLDLLQAGWISGAW